MNDLAFWRDLTTDRATPDGLLEGFSHLHALAVEARMPWLGFVAPHLAHPLPQVRVAALRLFDRCETVAAWKLLLPTLADADPEVRAVAVEVWYSITRSDPLRRVHLLAHPDPRTRLAGFECIRAAGQFQSWMLFLLADPVCRPHIEAMIPEMIPELSRDPDELGMLLGLSRDGLIDPARTARILIEAGWPAVVRLMDQSVRRDPDTCTRIIDSLALPDRPAELAPGEDILDEVFDAIVAHRGAFPEALDAYLKALPRHLRAMRPANYPQRDRVRVALLRQFDRHNSELPRFGQALAIDLARFRDCEWIPIAERQEALLGFVMHDKPPAIPERDLRAILRGPLVRTADGLVHMRALAGLLRAAGNRPWNLLAKEIDRTEILEAFDADPLGSVPILSLRDDSADGQPMWVRLLLDRPGVPLVPVVAEFVHWIATDRYDLLSWIAPSTFIDISFAAMLVARPLSDNRARRFADRTILGWTTADALDWLRRWEATPAARTHPLALGIVGRILGTPLSIGEAVGETIAGLLSLESRVLEAAFAVLPLLDLPLDPALGEGLERGLAEHASEKLAAWSLAQSLEREARTRANAPPPDRKAMLVAGVCDRYAALEAPHLPSVSACVALLASSDPIAEIDREFCRFGGDDEAFARELDKEMIRHWRDARGMSPLGHAVLYRWEQHFPWLLEDGLALAGGRWAGMVDIGASLVAPLLRDRWFAAMQRQWQWWSFHNVPRLAAALDLELGRALVSRLEDELLAPRVVEVLLTHRNLWTALDGWPKIREAVVGNAPLIGEPLRVRLAPLIDLTGVAPPAVRRGVAPDRTAASGLATESIADSIATMLSSGDVREAFAAARFLGTRGRAAVERLADALGGATIPHPGVLAQALRAIAAEHLEVIAGLVSRAKVRADVRLLIGLAFAGIADPDRVRRTLKLLAAEPPEGFPDAEFVGFFERIGGWKFQANEADLVRVWVAARPRSVAVVLAVAEALLRVRDAFGVELLVEGLTRAPGDFVLTLHYWLRLLEFVTARGLEGGDLGERLVVSPHLLVYGWVVERLCEREAVPPVLKTFLELGTRRLASVRTVAVRRLASVEPVDADLLPLLLPEVLAGTLKCPRLLAGVEAIADRLTTGVLLVGTSQSVQNWVVLLSPTSVAEGTRAEQLTRVMLESTSPLARRWARREMYERRAMLRSELLDRVAHTFVRGIRTARMLTGNAFRIEMIADRQLGYTRLNQNRIWVSPIPILRRAARGEDVVRGLIVHELGHHIYHKGAPAEAIWKRATDEKIHGLLNLVADEHLERNLRVTSEAFGDDLKQLGAYAFMHSDRDVGIRNLVRLLGGRAFAVLSGSAPEVSNEEGCVKVVGGASMHRMETEGVSFVRFFRALRMGLGNRRNDPKVEAGLKLFRGKGFKASTMADLWEITKELRAIFGEEVRLIESLGQCEGGMGTEGEFDLLSEGLTQEELDRRIREIMDGRKSDSDNDKVSRQINLSDEESFAVIANIAPVAYDPVGAAALAGEVARPARLLKKYLHDLGLRFVAQRMRLSGRQFDRTRTNALVLRGDPRVLIARRVRQETDLFVGIAIDCSGSMAMHGRLEKAKRFGALIAEAVRGRSEIDARFFGFTDSTLFDAGTAERCGVSQLHSGGGNNDAAALWHVSRVALRSRRRAKLLVMISDGSPTECSVTALTALVRRLSRGGFCCAQVAVAPIDHICFPNYVLLEDAEIEDSVRRFGQVMAKLVRRALGT